MNQHGQSFSELPYLSTRGKSSVLNLVTREVCEDCNNALSRLEQQVKPVFLALARAAEQAAPITLPVSDAKLLARWAEKMAITNELAGGAPRVATSEMGQAILGGRTIRSAAVWAARHDADYMLSTALAHPAIAASEIPEPGEYERHAAITAITYHYLTLLVFIPGPGGPYVQPGPPPYSPDRWTLIWPVKSKPEFPPLAAVDARELERAVTDFSRWLRTPRAMRFIHPSPVPPKVVHRN
jgi:hypothetical protein